MVIKWVALVNQFVYAFFNVLDIIVFFFLSNVPNKGADFLHFFLYKIEIVV